MKTTITILSVLLIFLIGTVNHNVFGQDHSEEKKKILQAIENGLLGWEQRDMELATRDYAEKTDWTNAFGDRYQSREELKEYFGFLFKLSTVMAGKTEHIDHDITFLRSDIALVRSKSKRVGQKLEDGTPHGDRNITHLRVFEKQDGKWRIVSHLIAQQLDDSKR
ncbi:MAG: hypothetical protein AAF554_17075 [Bacteroidota bacterium]